MSDVFISYAREDLVFVRRLCETLRNQDREVWVDLDGVYAGEEFWPTICSGIEDADTFAFVISYHSIDSEYCRKELEHARKHNKRIVPLIHHEVNSEKIPPPMASLQWIFFREQDDFDDSVKLLTEALSTDLEWVRTHTRLLVRAREWEKKKEDKEDKSYVLRGSDLKGAEAWLAQATDHEQKPTLLQTQYITASRKTATRRLGVMLGAVTFGFVVAVLLALLAFNQRQEAVEQRQIAEKREQIALARQLAVQAEFTRNQQPNQLPQSVRLAVEATRRFQSVEAEQPLRSGVSILPHVVTHKDHREEVLDIAFSPDGKYIATRVRDTHRVGEPILVWNTSNGREVARLKGRDRWVALAFSQDSRYLNTASPGNSVVWEVPAGREVSRIKYNVPSWGFFSKPAVFNRGAKYLALFQGNVVEVWEVSSGRAIKRLVHGEKVEAAVFSQDGKYLATVAHDNTVVVWEVDTGQKAFSIPHKVKTTRFARFLTPVSFSPDGKHLATASGNIVGVWDVSSGREVTRIVHGGQVTKIEFTSDGKYLATAGRDNAARVWEAASGKQFQLVTHAGFVNSVAFSPDGKYLATGSADNTARLWKTDSGREVARMSHKSTVTNVTFSPDGQRLATADEKRTVWVWKVSERPDVVRIPHFRLSGLRLSPDGRFVATVVRIFSHYNVVINEVASGQHIASIASGGRITDFAFSHDGRFLATATGWVANIWELSGEKKIASMLHQGKVEHLDFSPDGQYLATVSDGNTVSIWEAASGRQVTRKNHRAGIDALSFTPDGKHLTIVQSNNTVVIREMADGREVASMIHKNEVIRVAVSLDGKYLVTASDDGFIRIWGVVNGQQLTRLNHGSKVNTLAFSPDGKHLATAALDQTLRVWELPGGREITSWNFEGKALRFSPDLKHLATVSQTNIRIWDINNGREIARMNNNTNVNALLFSAEGKYLVTASWGDWKSIQVWLWHPEDLINEACTRLDRNLTYNEWQQYFGDEPYRKICDNLPIHPTFIKTARNLARDGDVERSVANFQHALKLEPGLKLDPEQEAHRFSAKGLITKGNTLARKGDTHGAAAIYQRALEIDPSLDLNPEAEAARLSAWSLVEKGRIQARNGDVEGATELFQKATELNRKINIDPEAEAEQLARLAAPELGMKAKRLAEGGNIEGAIAMFQRVQKITPKRNFDPEAEAKKWAAKGLLDQGNKLAYEGKVKETIAAYEKAQTLDPTLTISAEFWGRLCWNASLFGYAADVMEVCERAVSLSADAALYPGDFLARESRGLARAMAGNQDGAIEDFQTCVERTKNKEKKAMYQEWIKALQSGENPFTQKWLEKRLLRR